MILCVSRLQYCFKIDSVSTEQGIQGETLSRANVEVMGNIACTLDGSYIWKADPLILEKLKVCKDLSETQVASIERLLLSGKTPYGYKKRIQLTAIEIFFSKHGQIIFYIFILSAIRIKYRNREQYIYSIYEFYKH